MNMQNGYGGKPANNYLAQRINGATAEELAALLLEGACRFLLQAAAAIRRKDIAERTRLVNRVSLIMDELLSMLNPEGGEVVDKLHGIYIWWIKELFEAGRGNEPERLEAIVRQMVAMRAGWEELSQSNRQAQVQAQTQAQPTQFTAEPKQTGFSLQGLVG
jgi:flagellar protein FliS